ncbi:biotin-dependent carboxyltransferase family protein [Chitinivorax sp. B]|uniref:5-oxoprolinase subunit C family protein n=1 Tax=Chitinivorax sp. B TaxID=2502235 RepID=UPI0010F5B653|nr:biotin-dependent carboxyltransferase family protein [Chitinivorax sp. B]
MLEIIRPGVQTTVQDLGRHGFRHLGIAQAGALDQPALMLANRLVNNPADAAGLEVVMGPVAIRFHRDGWLALTGADFDARLDDTPLWPGWRVPYLTGQTLHLAGPRLGMRAYLAVDGGIDVPLVLGARATDLRSNFGGFAGRALQAGDLLPQGQAIVHLNRCGAWTRPWSPVIRLLPGPEYHEFDDAVHHAFWQKEWKVSSQSDRMGYRLQGPPLHRSKPHELLSHGVLPGVVQVPPNGQPIVLLADAQTTGGYPRIASVIEADLWKLAQARPGTRLHFVKTTLDDARQAMQQWQFERNRFEWSAYGR